MSSLDLLPVASMVGRAPPGHSNRVRTPADGVDLDALDAEVEAAGGWIERRTIPASNRVGRGRRTASAPHVASWYVIPDSAFAESSEG
jgi:hypothetical protein